MLYIRVDMNQTIATGHVMRCLAIADALSRLGETVTFVVADENPVELLTKRGYQTIVLHTDWRDMEGELPALLAVLRQRRTTKMLIDSYQVTERYLRKLKEEISVCYMDDLNAFAYPVDMLICYANYSDGFGYPERLTGTELCLGVQYVPLRTAFQDCPAKQIPERAKRLLLLSGGTDPFHILRGMMEALMLSYEELFGRFDGEIDVICGAWNQDYNWLVEHYKEQSHVRIHRQVADMERYMQQADIAVSAGGFTLYELCACGTPAISYAFADNQLENVRRFDADGLIPYAGDWRKDDVIGNVLSLLRHLIEDAELRGKCSGQMRRQVDGRGAMRIAEKLLEWR